MEALRVLLLEDDPADAELALAALAEGGIRCEPTVVAGRAAFETAYAPGSFDLVLADYKLPDYTGLEALQFVRRQEALVPFVLVSGTIGEELAVETLRAGATDYVLKDGLARVAPAVRRALEERRSREQHLATQSALEQSERRYRAIVEDQSELIVRLLPDFTISFVNPAWCEFFGRRPESLIGRSILDVVGEARREEMRRSLGRLGPEYVVVERDAQVADGGGRLRWMHWVSRGVFDEDGRLTEIQSVGRDVTELHQSLEALRSAQVRLRGLSRRLLDVQETERRHLARDLHDDVGQALTALKIQLESRARVDDCVDTVRHTLERVRQLSLSLRPSQLDDLGLAAALRSHLDRQARVAGIAAHFDATDAPPDMGPETETACFRVAQEAINNVLRHAEARNLWLRLFTAGGRLALSVRDDGHGFDLQDIRSRTGADASLGLVGMEERIALVGGSLELRSDPDKGTVVVATFPVLRVKGEQAA